MTSRQFMGSGMTLATLAFTLVMLGPLPCLAAPNAPGLADASVGGAMDASSDAGEQDGGEDDAGPWGIQPTTTPDNLGCQAAPGTGSSFGSLGAFAIAGMAAVLGRRTSRQRKS